MQRMANWLASALPVADAVSFEFDDINVTAQHVMTQTATLLFHEIFVTIGFNGEFLHFGGF